MIIRSYGLAKPPMIFATVMNVLNTVLNLLLILGMGVKGAALATVIGRTVGVVGNLLIQPVFPARRRRKHFMVQTKYSRLQSKNRIREIGMFCMVFCTDF